MADYLEAHQLASMLRGPEATQVLVIDVRDEDFAGGHIKGCVNIESDQFHNASGVDSIIEQNLTEGISKVVLHCMFSQQRGPRCALSLAKRLREKKIHPAPLIYILKGGFVRFLKEYGSEADLVQDIDPTVWS